MNTEILCVKEDTDMETACLRAGEVLKRGGIVAFPTDTVYGLGACCRDAEAVRKIFAAKGRPEGKPLSILVSDISQVEALAEHITLEARKLMEHFWPGALTLIFKKKPGAGIPDEVTAGGDTIGVRFPADALTVHLITAAGSPLAAPSANRSGNRSAVTAQEVKEDLDGRIDILIDGGMCPVGVSSTVVDVSTTVLRILREGTITRQMIEDVTDMKVEI